MYYVPDVTMRKIKKKRRKKKRFRNEMDDMEKGYRNDMYGSGDFNQIKNKVRCFICHTEGHTMNRLKKGQRGIQGLVAPWLGIIDRGQPIS
jgi:hypothetical protein